MARVNKSTMIGELLQIDENVAPILLNIGMHCFWDAHHLRWRLSSRLLWYTVLTLICW